MPAILDHYRPTDSDDANGTAVGTSDGDGDGYTVPAGAPVYRVVGTGETVTLLRVTDGDGRRVNSGELLRVPVEAFEPSFEPAADPDAGLHPVRAVRNALSGLYWQFRRFL